MRGQPPKLATFREVEGELERFCRRCSLWVPYDADHFNRDVRSATGLQTPCKRCSRAVSKQWQRKRYRPLARAA